MELAIKDSGYVRAVAPREEISTLKGNMTQKWAA
jgi:hypothetical protein